jgi:hypothetical protein
MSGLTVSKKHGLNPSIVVCILCHKDTGVALLGALPGDAEAPRKILDPFNPYEPCPACKEAYLSQGTLLLSVTEDKKYVGDLMVLKDAAFRECFGEEPPKGKVCFVDKSAFDQLYANYQAVKNGA